MWINNFIIYWLWLDNKVLLLRCNAYPSHGSSHSQVGQPEASVLKPYWQTWAHCWDVQDGGSERALLIDLQLIFSAGPMEPDIFLPSSSTHQQTRPFLEHCLVSKPPSVQLFWTLEASFAAEICRRRENGRDESLDWWGYSTACPLPSVHCGM